jgi:hypothetical protein
MRKSGIALILLALGCSRPPSTIPKNVRPFFPVGALAPGSPDLDEHLSRWYSTPLWAMNEPRLFENSQGEGFRFTWIGSFGQPFSVRVTKYSTGASATGRVADGVGGFRASKIIKSSTRQISSLQWEELVKEGNAIQFWELPPEQGILGMDGSRWVLEAYQDGRYHVVAWFAPTKGSAFRILCLKMVRHSGLEGISDDLY